MTGERQNFTLARMGTFILPAWIAFVALMFIPNWHPWRLMSLMLPVLPLDEAAAVLRLVRHGLPELGMLGLILLSAVGLGCLILRPFRMEADAGRRLTLSFGLGLAALSYLSLFLGLAGRYDTAGLAFVIIVMSLSGLYGGFYLARSLRGSLRRARPGWGDIVFFCLLAAVSVFLLAKALRPAVFYDAITYHLGVPNYYLQEGGISYIPYDSYSNFPFAAEMLYTLGMFTSGLGTAQLLSPAVFLAATMLVYEFTRSYLPGVPAALPAAFCLLTPAFMENTVQFSNDLMLMYYSVLVLYCFFAYEKDGSRAWIVLMGIFTGVCIGTKYIALVSISVPATLAVAYIVYRDRAKGQREALWTLLAFALPALAVSSPWLIKNLAYTGNPFYPAFYGIFGGADMATRFYAVHKAAAGHTTLAAGAMGLLKHPWDLFMASPAETSVKYGAASALGPFLMLFSPALFFVRGVGSVVKKLCLFSAVLFVAWCLVFPLARFLYPAIAVMTVAASYAIAKVFRSAPLVVRGIVAAALVICLAFDMCLGFFQIDRWTDAYGLDHVEESDYDYMVRRAEHGGAVMLQAVPVYRWLNENAPRDARVLIIGDAQHLYIERRHLYAYLSAKNPYDFFGQADCDNDAISERLKSEGVTHVVYNPDELRRLQKGGYTSFPDKGDVRIEEFLKSGHVRLVSSARLHGRPVYGFEVE